MKIVLWESVLLIFLCFVLSSPDFAKASSLPSNPSSVDVSSYEGLRALAGSSGQTVTLSSSTNPEINGSFTWQSSDPNGNGDDGGIVLQASGGGYWVRDFAHTLSDPIQLDWFQLGNNQEVTSLITDLAHAYAPQLYVKVPSTSMTLLLDYVDFDALGIRYLGLLESNVPVTIQQKGDGAKLLNIQDYQELVLGTLVDKGSRDAYNLTFVGSYTFDHHATLYNNQSLVRIKQDVDCNCETYLRYNTRDAYAQGLIFIGGGNVNTVFVSGRHENSSVKLLSRRIRHAVFEDPLVTDPNAVGMGWLGGSDGAADQDKTARTRGVDAINVRKISGSITLQYGWAWFFSIGVNDMGNGSDDPFVITTKDMGYSQTGVAVEDTPGWLRNEIKFDGTGVDQPGRRFVKIVEDNTFGDNLTYKLWLEASSCDDVVDCSSIITSHIDFTLVNVSGRINDTGNGTIDRIYGITYRGNGAAAATTDDKMLVSDNATVRDGQFHRIEVWPPDNGTEGNNTIQNVTVTNKVVVRPDVPGTTLEDVTWSGGSREVMSIASGSDVTATNLTAPSGSTIEGGGQLTLNGQQVSLPYTFTGDEGSGDTNQAPSASNQSVVTDEDQPVAITLAASDPDGDPLTYSVTTPPTNGTLSGQAPDLTYTPDPGYAGSDSFTFKANDGQEDSNVATVSITVNATATTEGQDVSLRSGWNTVSLYVEPSDAQMETLLADIQAEVVLVKDGAGQVYAPDYGINDIGSWSILEAYHIYMEAAATLTVEGERIAADATSIPLQAGWNLAPYMLDYEQPIEEALFSIAGDVVLVKDQEGRVYSPEYGINEIGMMEPGWGYRIYTDQSSTLTYSSSGDLEAYWSFDAGNTSTVVDVSGNGYDGTLVGAARASGGAVGEGVSFDGVDDYVDLNSMDITGTAVTMAAWFKADDFGSPYPHARIISKATGGSGSDHWWMISTVDEGDAIRLRFRLKTDGTTTELVADSGDLVVGEWVHVVARYDGTEMQLYKNGVLVGQTANSGSISTNAGVDAFIGKNPNTDYGFFDGMIDEVRIYNRALSVEEIQDLYASGVPNS